MVSHLTTSADVLFSQMVAGLTDYPFNPLTTSQGQYLATVANGLTGGSYSHLVHSEAQLLALIASNLTETSISALSSSVPAMLALIVNNPPAEGGGGEPYEAQAVNFDGSTYLVSTTAFTDTAVFSFSVWTNDVDDGSSQCVFFAEDIEEDIYNNIGFTIQPQHIEINASDEVIASANLIGRFYPEASGCHHWLGVVKTNSSAGLKKVILYKDRVRQPSLLLQDSDGAFTMPLTGIPFAIGAVPSGAAMLVGDLGELWLAPGVDLSSGDTIPDATLNKFITIDGAPVDLGENGQIPTGSSQKLFRGDAVEWASRAVTYGFTITGALTDSETTVEATLDGIAPVLSNPSGGPGVELEYTSVDVEVDTTEGNGTMFVVLTESATTPTFAQIVAAQDASGGDAAGSAQSPVVSGSVEIAGIGGGNPATTYYAHFAHQDRAGNRGTPVSSASFTTDPAP